MSEKDNTGRLRRAGYAAAPVVLLVVAVAVLLVGAPGFERGAPQPDVSVSHHTIPNDETINLHVTNDGAGEVTISQVMVGDAYWNFDVEKVGGLPFSSAEGENTLGSGESARVVVPYHLTMSPGNAVEVTLMIEDGGTFTHEIAGVQTTSGFGGNAFLLLALIGLFVGVIPVAVGMLWFPLIASMSRRNLFAVLAFAAGVLAFLAVDGVFEAFEIAENVPGTYSGEALVVLSALVTYVVVEAVSARTKAGNKDASGLRVAYLVALGIGLHNLAEGLAIGSAYSLGRMSFAGFLVVGFMLHNVTEGPAVVAPVGDERPSLWHFVALGALAGAPVIVGGWIGALSVSPVVGVVFLGVGVGAIAQVVGELVGMARSDGAKVGTASNLVAFGVGATVMYATGLFVAL
ncbi:MAG: metal transporter [Halobacteriales archaeon]|nr:metal transporter [Halobacteriales archaeon]